MADSEPTLTVAQYARKKKRTIGHIYSQLWSGRLAGKKVEGQWRISDRTPSDGKKADARPEKIPA